jgi:aromatic ring-opening dioxygenase LigB subunit
VAGDLGRFGAPEVRFDFETDQELAGLIVEEAAVKEVRLTRLRRWDGGLDWGCTVPLYFLREALAGARLLPINISWLEPRFHFDLGRAIGRALAGYDRRVAFVCSVDLSHALSPDAPSSFDRAGAVFDERYRRTIDTWDVKWLVNLESSFRGHAAEDAVPQTAILMGALSSYSIQPRVLSYESPFGVGYLVAAIDILGPRRGSRSEAERKE